MNPSMTQEKVYKLYLFDADGTLRRCTIPGQPCPNKPGEWEVLPGVKERLAKLPPGHRCGIITNQGGIGLGHLEEDVAHDMIDSLVEALWSNPWDDDGPMPLVEVCPHTPKAGCLCRKPSPWLLQNAMDDAGAKPGETLFVGDMASDQQAAQRAGCDFAWACDFFGWGEPCEGKRQAQASGEAAVLAQDGEYQRLHAELRVSKRTVDELREYIERLIKRVVQAEDLAAGLLAKLERREQAQGGPPQQAQRHLRTEWGIDMVMSGKNAGMWYVRVGSDELPEPGEYLLCLEGLGYPVHVSAVPEILGTKRYVVVNVAGAKIMPEAGWVLRRKEGSADVVVPQPCIDIAKPGCGVCGAPDATWRGGTLRQYLCDACGALGHDHG